MPDLRTEITRAVAKALAYRSAGKEQEARYWAERIIQILQREGLL